MSISLDEACHNIFKDDKWLFKYLLFFCIVSIPIILELTFMPVEPQTAKEMYEMYSSPGWGLYLISAILASVFSNGYMLTYLRNLIADKQAILPDWKDEISDIIKSGLLAYLVTVSVVIIFLILAVPFVITGIVFYSVKAIVPVIIVGLIYVLLLLAIVLLYWPLWLNFAEKNFDFPAFFNIKRAVRYVFCGDYWLIGLICILMGIAVVISLIILSVIFVAAQTKLAEPVLMLIYMFFASFILLILTNLYAQLYYSVNETDKKQLNFRNCPSCGRLLRGNEYKCPVCGADLSEQNITQQK